MNSPNLSERNVSESSIDRVVEVATLDYKIKQIRANTLVDVRADDSIFV